MPRYTTEYFDGFNLDDYLSYVLKQEGSERFFAWEIEKGVAKCSGFRYVPFKTKKERIVLHGNRAQCYFLLKDAEGAISDAT